MKDSVVKLKYYKEDTISFYYTIQSGIRGGLASVLIVCYFVCNNSHAID